MAKTIWGKTLGMISAIPAVYVGAAKGTYNVVSGKGTFKEGVDSVFDPVVDTVMEFGDKHADELTGAAINMAAGLIGKGVYDSTHPKLPIT
jgi:hypothetical protein